MAKGQHKHIHIHSHHPARDWAALLLFIPAIVFAITILALLFMTQK